MEKVIGTIYRIRVTKPWRCLCGKLVHEGESKYHMQDYGMYICGLCAFKWNGYTPFKN